MVPNPTAEIYFLVQILTTSATCVPTRHEVLSGGTEGKPKYGKLESVIVCKDVVTAHQQLA